MYVEGHRVIVKIDALEEKPDDSLILRPIKTQEDDQRSSTIGTYVDGGPSIELQFKGREIKPGDRVLFVQYAGILYRDGDDVLQVMNDEDLLAIIDT